MNTVVIGTAFVDIKAFAHGSYDPNGRNLGSIKFVHGGVGRNVGENFANVGMPVSFVGMLEDSVTGRDVEEHLLSAGVCLDDAIRPQENGIGMWMVILDEHGALAGSISSMPDIKPLEDYLEKHAEDIIKEAENIVLEVDLNENIAEMVIELAGKYNKKVFTIVGNMSVILARPDLIKKTSCFICNEIEAAKFFHNKTLTAFSPEQMAEYLPSAVKTNGIKAMVVTMGAHGAVFFDGENDGENAGICGPEPTKVVDSTGAGDAFFSGTVMGLTRGMGLEEAVKYGAKLASRTISVDQNVCPVDKAFFA